MSPPNSVWMLAPMLPTTERERTTMPRTVPSSRVTRNPVSEKPVVFCKASMRGGGSGEADLGRVALGGVVDLEELGGQEAEHAGENHVGERLARRVVGHDAVVVGLAGGGGLFLRGGEFLGELHHVLVNLEGGVLLGDDHQAGEGAGQAGFGGDEALHGIRVGRVGGGGLGGR